MQPDWPLLWVQGDPCTGEHVWGTQAFALEGKKLRRIVLDGRTVGTAWTGDGADYCLLAGILPVNLSASRGEQTYSCFEQMETALVMTGMDFSHVARTWLYLDHLLDWYDEFNEARTRFFEERCVFERMVPASTGIGGGNPFGAALSAGVLAVRPHDDRVQVREVVSPLQCPATAYRSSFSRAVEIDSPEQRLLLVSGTASISPGGESLYADDTEKQIHLTLDVVEAILKSRGMDWKDTTRAIGYFYDIAAIPVFEQCCRERGMPPIPLLPVHATVCRHDLLFEIELDAVAKRQKNGTEGSCQCDRLN
jgi:enamine deaminase RidA (YjgF/YER057c/UK114 family)